MKSLIASRHFDGERYHQDPATLLINGTRIVDARAAGTVRSLTEAEGTLFTATHPDSSS